MARSLYCICTFPVHQFEFDHHSQVNIDGLEPKAAGAVDFQDAKANEQPAPDAI